MTDWGLVAAVLACGIYAVFGVWLIWWAARRQDARWVERERRRQATRDHVMTKLATEHKSGIR